MTNFEKYKDEILDLSRCRNALIKWLYAKAKPTLTAKERAFCEIVSEGCIARDKDGELYAYLGTPIKEEVQWSAEYDCLDLNNEYFSFITWEDEKPWSIEELLKLEVV